MNAKRLRKLKSGISIKARVGDRLPSWIEAVLGDCGSCDVCPFCGSLLADRENSMEGIEELLKRIGP